MAELSTLARPYAKAAFEFSLDAEKEAENLAKWSQALNLAATITQDPQLKELLSNPNIEEQQLLSIYVAILGEQTDEKFLNFLKVLSANDRLATMPDISEQFEALKADHEKTVDVELTSAVALTPEQQQLFKDKLSVKLGRKVTIQNQIDPSVIGGLMVKAEDLVIDGTVSGKIAKLTETLIS